MAGEVKIRLINGPFDGVEVEDAPSEVLWVYKNMYGQTKAIRAGGMPRTPTMAAYVVVAGQARGTPQERVTNLVEGARQPAH
jgi:hypothetical protein